MTDLQQLILSLLPVLAQVESNNNPNAVGDGGKAIGIYQIHAEYWEDGCNFKQVDWPYDWAKRPNKSAEIVTAYLMYYGMVYEKRTGKKATAEVLCRIHNGGPSGWKKKATVKYWNKCKRLIPAAAAERPAGSK
jgi:hypothetical protein